MEERAELMKGLKKKLTASLLALCLLSQSQSAFALYYKRSEPTAVSASRLSYIGYDQTIFDRVAQKAGELIGEPGNSMELSAVLDECYNEYCKAVEQAYIADLEMNKNYNDTTVKNKTDAYSVSLDVTQDFTDLLKSVYYSEEYGSLLENIFGTGNVDLFLDELPSDEYYSLSKQEQELVSEYYDIYGKSDECATLYLKLVDIRNQMANAEGYNNYADYANKILYARGYTEEQTVQFCEEVSEHLKPFVSLLLDATLYVPHDSIDMSDSEIISNIGSYVADINGELYSSYNYMVSNKLYDISYSDSKVKTGGAFTLNLPQSKVPYLFIAPTDANSDSKTIHSLIHEFGHYSAMLKDPKIDESWSAIKYNISVETSEVQSQGLELLFMDYYGQMFGRSATYERYSQLLSNITAILDGCMFNEWQTMAYSADELTVEKLNEAAAELIRKYYGFNYTPDAAQTVWTSLMHNYVSPMYYFSYAVSGASALSILSESSDSRENSVDAYMKLSAIGAYYPYMDAMNESGIVNVFDDNAVENIADGVGAMFGLNYEDVDYKAWYIPYIYITSPMLEGTDDGRYMPNEDITRSDFVMLIGKMYDYYVGINREYTISFNDVSSTDESAPYIAWAYSNGIIDGYEDGSFGGGDSITREQLVAILYRLAKLEGEEYKKGTGVLGVFYDNDLVSDWAIEPLSWAVENGIIDGRDNNLFEPQGGATRAEAAKIASTYLLDRY